MDLKAKFKQLINNELPAACNEPIQYNHCFNRVILDWLFKDCWYNHLDKNKTALHQLNEQQLEKAIKRMNKWLLNKDVLIEDNNASLTYRKLYKENT